MELQSQTSKHSATSALLNAVQSSVSSSASDICLDASDASLWQRTKEIGSTQMTPLAQSFQTLYNTLEQLSYSLDDADAATELSPLTPQGGLGQTTSDQLDTSDSQELSELSLIASEVSISNMTDTVTMLSSHMTDGTLRATDHIESNNSNINVGAESTLLAGAPVSEESAPLRTKIAADVALALDSALSNNSVLSDSSSFADVPVFKSGGEALLPGLAISRQQTPNNNGPELVQRLRVDTLFAPFSDSFRAEMNVLAQHVSSMQSHTPNSLKVNEASWKALVGHLQPMNNQSAIYPSTPNTPSNGLVVPMESLTTAIDNLGSRATSTNLMVEKSLPIEAQRQIYQAVKDKVQLQLDMNTQVARIRFDPPELGRMEMVLRIEGDKLTVQMSASAATTREVLMATSERLRHELIAQNSALSEVEVALSQQHHSANPEQYLPSFAEQEHEDSSGEESPNVPEYTAYIARV